MYVDSSTLLTFSQLSSNVEVVGRDKSFLQGFILAKRLDIFLRQVKQVLIYLFLYFVSSCNKIPKDIIRRIKST